MTERLFGYEMRSQDDGAGVPNEKWFKELLATLGLTALNSCEDCPGWEVNPIAIVPRHSYRYVHTET